MEETSEQGSSRNPDGTFKAGVSGNPGGRPKNTLKGYVQRKLDKMTDDEKEEFLKGIDKDLVWRMAEGNPANNTDLTTDGRPIILLTPEIVAKNALNETHPGTE